MAAGQLLLTNPADSDFSPRQKVQTLVCINDKAEESVALRTIVEDLEWRVRIATTCMEALSLLRSEPAAAIFCEATLTDGTWRDVLNQTGGGAGAPALIVTSRLADAYLWSEVLNLGGYDVLATPFTSDEVAHVLTNLMLRSVSGPKYAAAAVNP